MAHRPEFAKGRAKAVSLGIRERLRRQGNFALFLGHQANDLQAAVFKFLLLESHCLAI